MLDRLVELLGACALEDLKHFDVKKVKKYLEESIDK